MGARSRVFNRTDAVKSSKRAEAEKSVSASSRNQQAGSLRSPDVQSDKSPFWRDAKVRAGLASYARRVRYPKEDSIGDFSREWNGRIPAAGRRSQYRLR